MAKLREGEIAAVADELVHDIAGSLDVLAARGGGGDLSPACRQAALMLAIVVELRRLADCVSEIAEVIRPTK